MFAASARMPAPMLSAPMAAMNCQASRTFFWAFFRSAGSAGRTAPEAAAQLGVGDDPALGRLPLVVDVEDVNDLVRVRLPVALERAVHQRDDVLVIGDDVVEVERDVLQLLRVAGNRRDCGVFALEVSAEDTAASVPDVVVAPRIGQCLHIAPFEGIERIANELNLLVVADLRSDFRHCALL